MGSRGGVDAARATAVLHPFPQRRADCSTPWSPIVRCATAVPTHRRSATLWGRRCSPCWPVTSATPISPRCDAVLPELLGMSKIVSEDAVRRAFKAIEEKEGATWLRRHLAFCAEPLLAEPWILDVDTMLVRLTHTPPRGSVCL